MEPTGVEGRTAQPVQRPSMDDSQIGTEQGASAGGGTRQDARERGRRWAAEISGALEGFLESLERYDVEQTAKDAMHEEAEMASAVAGEARRQIRTPEMQDLGHDISRGADKVRSTASSGADQVQSKAQDVQHAVEEQWHEVREDIEHGIDRVQEMGHVAMDETKERGHLMARAGRRARKAPKLVLQDTRQAVGSWGRGLAAGIGLYVAAGVVALTTFIVLTIALVAGFNAVMGAPEGTFLVAGIYAIVAAGCVMAARAARKRAKEASAEHMDDARRELQNVARPLRRAFSAHRVSKDEPTPSVPAGGAPNETLVLEEHEWRRR